MNGDGSGQQQLTKDAAMDLDVAVSPDDRYIVWTSDRSGLPHIWRMNIDGSDARALTVGDTFDDLNPTITPDGKWVIYNSWRTGKLAPWKVGIDGGEPQLLIDAFATVGSVSPDGQTFLAAYLDQNRQPATLRAALLPVGGGQAIKIFEDIDLPRNFAHSGTAWSPDGKTIFYVFDRNVYSFPAAGGKPKPITNFKTETLFELDASPDARRFVFSRGEVTNDVVLIRDFR
jgi:Tol biopolymer transport system component